MEEKIIYSDENNVHDNNEKKVYDNDNAVTRVPKSERRSLFNIIMVISGYCICMSGLYTGASMSAGLTLTEAIIATVVGNLILTIYGGLVGVIGSREGATTSMLTRHSFGREGSKIISIILGIVMIGWYAYQVGFFGETINTMFPNGGFITNKFVASIWGGCLMMLTAYFGYKALSILSMVMIPLIFTTASIGVGFAVNHAGGLDAVFSLANTGTMTMNIAIVSVVGSFATGAAIQSDITRYAKSSKDTWIATSVGFIIANLFIIVAGFITCKATGAGDLPSSMIMLGLGIPALVVLIGGQWTTNDSNLYSSSLAFSNVVNLPKKKIVLLTGIVATLIGGLGLSGYFTAFLSFLGIGMPPMAAVVIIDYYILKGKHYDFESGTKYCKFNILAFIAWIIAFLVGYLVPVGIGSINSFITAAILYGILMKTIGKNNFGIIGETVQE